MEYDGLDDSTVQRVLTEMAVSTATAVVNVLNVLGPDVVIVKVCSDSSTYWNVLTETALMKHCPLQMGNIILLHHPSAERL